MPECDNLDDCIGLTLRHTVSKVKFATTCKLIKGDDRPGRPFRTVVRTDVDRIGQRFCASGYVQNDGDNFCSPITTVQQVTLVLIADGTCDAAALQSVKEALYRYLSDPSTSYGVYTPKLTVDINCMLITVPQVSLSCCCAMA